MSTAAQTLVIPVNDLTVAKSLYTTLLGVEPYVDEAYYVGFRPGEVEIGLDPHGHRHGMTPYYGVADIETSVRELVAAGASVQQEAKDVGGGKLTAIVTDPDGNVVGLAQAP